MAWGNAAPRGWPDQDTLDPGELNTYIPYKTIFFPAGCMAGAYGDREPVFQTLRIAAQQQCLDVWTFADTDPEKEVHFVWAFKAHPIQVASLDLVFYPIWFQSEDSSAPTPTEYVYWSMAIANRNYDGDLNINVDNPGKACFLESPVLDQWHFAGGDKTNTQAGGRITDLEGTDPANASNWNLFQIMVERQSDDAKDTYTDREAHLLGVAMRYKTNWYNLAAWPYV